MGQQPMGNASAQPGGGIPSYAQPYMSNFGSQNQGGGMGNASAGGFQGGSPFGMQQQQPYGMQQMQNPFGGQQMGALSSPGYGMNQFQAQQTGALGQGGQQMGQLGAPNQTAQPMPQQPNQPQSFEQYRATPRMQDQQFRSPEQQLQEDQKSYQSYKDNFGQPQGQQQMQGQFGQQAAQAFMRGQQQPMPQPMGQRPAFLDNPDFQAYQKQEQDLGRQMNEYMQKAPMFQQMQDLQGKMRGMAQPQQGQMGQMGQLGQLGQLEQRGQMGQNPYLAQRDQMQRQRDMQDQQDYQQRYQQATQDDMRAGFAVMPNQSGYQGQMGDTGFRAMPAVMPPQTTQDDAMRTALGHPPLSSSKMGMPDFGGRGGYGGQMGGGYGGRMGGGYGGRMGGFGGGYGGQMGLQGLASMLQGRRGGF